MDRGYRFKCRISDLTGGGAKTRGVNIEITEGEDFETPERSQSNVLPVTPAHSSLVWWIAVAVVLMILILIVTHQG
jgi:hypothetical protein